MRSLHFTVAKNAVANVVRGGASAIVAIVLPHFLTRLLGPDRFAGWALMLQVAAYANYLDFGLQTAVARYLAAALEKNDTEQRDRLLTNAIAILTGAGAIAICGLGIVAWQLPHLFRSVPQGLAGEISLGVIILGLSAAIGLPLSAYTGALIGIQRNEFPAVAVATSRLLGALAVLLVVHRTHSLVWLALCIGGFNLMGGLVQYYIAMKLLPGLRLSFDFLDRAMTAELIRYCSTLSVWSLGMLLVSGLDVTIVGLFNFQAVGAYSIAATLIAFFTGLNGAAFSALLAPVAVLQARQENSRIARLILVTTRLSSYFSIGAVVAAFLFGEPLVRAWVGAAYLPITLPVLKILLVAQATRLIGNAYGAVLIGMGLQFRGLFPALVESLSNLLLSVVGMIVIGPEGVAGATLVAAVLSLAVIIFFVLPGIKELAITSTAFIQQGIALPLLPSLPILAWLTVRNWVGPFLHLSASGQQISMVIFLGVSIVLTWSGVRRTYREVRAV